MAVYTTIDNPEAYFQTKLYTGNGTDDTTISGVGFQSDLTWIKGRSNTAWHQVTDSVRGVGNVISTNSTGAESNFSSLKSWNSDGFVLSDNANFNGNGVTFASWNWKAGTSFTNDASGTGIGSVDSTGSVNTDAGFSIISYTGNGTSGATVAHGLGSVPDMYITKNRDYAYGWGVYHKSLGANYGLFLNDTAVSTAGTGWRNDTAPTSSVFTLGGGSQPYRYSANKSGDDYIAYFFKEKQGYSKFGSYTGNGSTDGTFVYTGFKPAFVMIKRTDAASEWSLFDNKRSSSSGSNLVDLVLTPNESSAEVAGGSSSARQIDLLSNGWKFKTTSGGINASGGTYIYMAFAENPFVTSSGIPTTGR